MAGNGWIWLEMDSNVLKGFLIVVNRLEWLLMAGIALHWDDNDDDHNNDTDDDDESNWMSL